MRDRGFDQLPVLAPGPKKRLVGMVTLGNTLSWIARGRAFPESEVRSAMLTFENRDIIGGDMRAFEHLSLQDEGEKKKRSFVEITMDTQLKALSRFFEWNSAAVVTEKGEDGIMSPVAVVTKVDLLTWLVRRGKIGR